MSVSDVDVVMATYQGGKYIASQIDSILQQTGVSLRLFIRDDGSSDETWSICQSYAAKHPQIITLLPKDERLGVRRNFSRLLERTQAPYVFLSDQDDVWLPGKIEATLQEMQRLESQFGIGTPILVHTDLHVVDSALIQISPSFWQYAHLLPQTTQTFPRLLVQNVVTGCSAVLNRALINQALPIPEECLMHDWWLALVAVAFGQIRALPIKTILYRQHGGNTLGAQPFFSPKRIWSKLQHHREAGMKRRAQAECFSNRFLVTLSHDNRQILDDFLKLDKLPWWRNRQLILKRRFIKNGWLRNVILLTNHPYP